MKKICDNCEGKGLVALVTTYSDDIICHKICSKCDGTGKREDKK